MPLKGERDWGLQRISSPRKGLVWWFTTITIRVGGCKCNVVKRKKKAYSGIDSVKESEGLIWNKRTNRRRNRAYFLALKSSLKVRILETERKDKKVGRRTGGRKNEGFSLPKREETNLPMIEGSTRSIVQRMFKKLLEANDWRINNSLK